MVFGLLRKEIPSMHAAAFLVGAAGLLSRLLGLFRDRLLAAEFGASRTLDLYYASFQLPDFFFTLFLLGAATPAILPVFIELWEKDSEKAREFIRGLVFFFSVFALFIGIVVVILAPYLVVLVAPGFDETLRGTMVTLVRIMMLSPIFLGVSNIFSSIVQARRRFFLFSLTSIVYNLGIILGILLFLPMFGVEGLAVGVVFGAFLHMAVQLPGIKDAFIPMHVSLPPLGSFVRVLTLSFPRVIASSLNQVVAVFLVAVGSFLSAGSITVFQFANNLRYLPVGIFGISYAIAAFPKLTEAALKKDSSSFYSDLYAMVESILFWVTPLAFLMVILRAHIVRLILGTGYFSWTDTRLTAAALAVLSVAVIAEGLSPLLLRAFYAIGNTRLPLAITGLAALLTAGVAPFFVAFFSSGRASAELVARLLKVGDIPDVGVLGLVAAFSLGAVIHVIGLWIALLSQMNSYFGATFKNGIVLAIARIATSSFFAACLGYGALYLVSFFISLDTFWGVFAQAFIAFSASAIFYGASMYAMGSEEMRSMIDAFRSRLWKRPPAVLPQELDDVTKQPLR
ncbi:MAG: hypothetical protein HY471_02435 [Candidatus Sungbacteria bacterium]|nr:hypothetical protein [Candidatus Sungbacteria bacterium]